MINYKLQNNAKARQDAAKRGARQDQTTETMNQWKSTVCQESRLQNRLFREKTRDQKEGNPNNESLNIRIPILTSPKSIEQGK